MKTLINVNDMEILKGLNDDQPRMKTLVNVNDMEILKGLNITNHG